MTFDVSPREEWFTPHSLPLVAWNVEGDYWENTIQKTVIKPDDNPFTDAELAGAMLWGMTFFGFTERDKWSQFDRPLYYYEEQLMSLEGKLYIKYLRDKKLKRQLKKDGMPYGIAFTMEVWNEIRQRQKHQNRSKRRRYYRIRQRIDQLKRLDKRQHLINRLQEVIAPDAIFASEILKTRSINEKWYDSHCYGKLLRLDYIIDLLENYRPYFIEICQSGNHNIVVCNTVDSTPMTEDEKNSLRIFLSNHFLPGSNWQLFFVTASANHDEMALQFIRIRHR